MKKNELLKKLKELENEIRNYRFIVENNTTKKIADSFSKVKEEYLSKKNELEEIDNYIRESLGGEEMKEKLIKINSDIMEIENTKRRLYFDIVKETEPEIKKSKIQEYLDNSELNKLKTEKNKILEKKELNYMVLELPKFTKNKSPEKTEPKKKKIIKRCPPGERKIRKQESVNLKKIDFKKFNNITYAGGK